LGCSAQFVKCNVTEWNDITNAFKSAIAFSPDKTVDTVLPIAGVAGDSLWGWLNNTKYDSTKPETSAPLAPPPKIIDINFTGVYNTVHAALWYFQNFPGTDLSYSKNVSGFASNKRARSELKDSFLGKIDCILQLNGWLQWYVRFYGI
jgi:NAD(P)-dependent dehydrogenase (short-subunit alcohol dehydrogenase family)